MFHKNRISGVFAIVVAFGLVLAACQSATVAPIAPQVTAPLPNTGATSTPMAPAQETVVTVKSNSDLGNILADKNGKTLYIYTKDAPNTSNCYDQCLAKWPALTVQQGAALQAGSGANVQLGTTQRKDGTFQVTVNGMPVYYWYKDQSTEDVSGQGIGSVWYVLDASGNIVKTPLPTTPTAPAAPTTMPTAAPAAAATSAPSASAPIIMAANSSLGMILTDSKGMTLYLFTVDQPNTSTCYNQCATNWPPLLLHQGENLTAASGISAKLGTTQRKDGSTQVTVNGMPVYYFFKDAKAGDVNGQGVGSVWYVLDPSGNAIQAAPAASPTAAPMNNSYNSYNP